MDIHRNVARRSFLRRCCPQTTESAAKPGYDPNTSSVSEGRVPTDINEIEAWTLQRVISSAVALADSGRYHDFTDIDYELRFERGWLQARALIDEREMRMLLNRRCADACEALTPPEKTPEPEALNEPEVIESVKPSMIRQAFALLSALMPSPTRWRQGRTA